MNRYLSINHSLSCNIFLSYTILSTIFHNVQCLNFYIFFNGEPPLLSSFGSYKVIGLPIISITNPGVSPTQISELTNSLCSLLPLSTTCLDTSNCLRYIPTYDDIYSQHQHQLNLSGQSAQQSYVNQTLGTIMTHLFIILLTRDRVFMPNVCPDVCPTTKVIQDRLCSVERRLVMFGCRKIFLPPSLEPNLYQMQYVLYSIIVNVFNNIFPPPTFEPQRSTPFS